MPLVKVCKFFDENLKWAVDKFHIRKHVEKPCILSSPDCVYHPDVEGNKELFGDVNLEVPGNLSCMLTHITIFILGL